MTTLYFIITPVSAVCVWTAEWATRGGPIIHKPTIVACLDWKTKKHTRGKYKRWILRKQYKCSKTDYKTVFPSSRRILQLVFWRLRFRTCCSRFWSLQFVILRFLHRVTRHITTMSNELPVPLESPWTEARGNTVNFNPFLVRALFGDFSLPPPKQIWAVQVSSIVTALRMRILDGQCSVIYI